MERAGVGPRPSAAGLTPTAARRNKRDMRTILLLAAIAVVFSNPLKSDVGEVTSLNDAADPAGDAKAECLMKTPDQMVTFCKTKTTATQCGWATTANMHDW